MTISGIEFMTCTHLDAQQISGVNNLLEQATIADGARQLNEHAWLHLRHGGDEQGHHVLAVIAPQPNGETDEQTIVGYAHVDITDQVEGASAELAVLPEMRNRGIGQQLVDQAIALSPDGRLRLWARGETPGAQALAQSSHFEKTRSLWQMRRSLFAPIPQPEIPSGIKIREFDESKDIDAWLDINKRAFADLPDQSSWTETDLRRRLAESWFCPEGFFIAERISDSQVVGFHWTKAHGDPPSGHHHPHDDHQHGDRPRGEASHNHDPIGEVYVLAVDPEAHIRGLGRALTLVGLNFLRSLGLGQAMLYVDSDNTRAIKLYTGLGFVHWDSDVMYKRRLNL
jgi:mycothiol synthase